MSTQCVLDVPDIARTGLRVALYLQQFAVLVSPSLFVLRLPSLQAQDRPELIARIAQTSLAPIVVASVLLSTAINQTLGPEGLTVYHFALVENYIFMLLTSSIFSLTIVAFADKGSRTALHRKYRTLGMGMICLWIGFGLLNGAFTLWFQGFKVPCNPSVVYTVFTRRGYAHPFSSFVQPILTVAYVVMLASASHLRGYLAPIAASFARTRSGADKERSMGARAHFLLLLGMTLASMVFMAVTTELKLAQNRIAQYTESWSNSEAVALLLTFWSLGNVAHQVLQFCAEEKTPTESEYILQGGLLVPSERLEA